MNLWLALAIFALSVTDDILCVWYYRRCNVGNRKLQASILSGALTGIVAFGVIFYVQDWKYLIPNILGSMVGTPLAIWIDEHWPEKKKPRTKTGQFKRNIPPEVLKSDL